MGEEVGLLSFFAKRQNYRIAVLLILHKFRRKLADFSDLFSWSKLAKIGNSNLSKLSAFAPVVGFVLFYGEGFKGFLSLAPIEPVCYGPTFINALSLRLDFTYVGLVLIGVGSINFGIFAPSVIKNYPTAAAFAERVAQSTLGYELNNMLQVIRLHLKKDLSYLAVAWRILSPDIGEEKVKEVVRYFNASSRGYRIRHLNRIRAIVVSLMEDVKADNEISDSQKKLMAGGLQSLTLASKAEDAPIFQKVIDAISGFNYVGYERYMRKHSGSVVFDLSVAFYFAMSGDRPLLRWLTAVFWMMGFLFLLVPTVLTAMYVLSGIFRTFGLFCSYASG